MKQSAFVSSSARKSRKAHFSAPSHIRRKLLSASLSKELREKYGVRAVPVRKGDTVQIVRGSEASRTGDVTNVARRKFRILVDGITATKVNGSTVQKGLHPSNVVITKLHLDADRKALLERRKTARTAAVDATLVD